MADARGAGAMEACKNAYDAAPELYKLTWICVDAHAHVEKVSQA